MHLVMMILKISFRFIEGNPPRCFYRLNKPASCRLGEKSTRRYTLLSLVFVKTNFSSHSRVGLGCVEVDIVRGYLSDSLLFHTL